MRHFSLFERFICLVFLLMGGYDRELDDDEVPQP